MNIDVRPRGPVEVTSSIEVDAKYAGPGPYPGAILMALSRKPAGQVYAGTANPRAVAKRRTRNRLARLSRKANR